jgi:Zn-dependent peptidase ImmA (M78 family)
MSVLMARRRAERLVQEHGIDRPAVDVKYLAQRLGIHVVHLDLNRDGLSGMLITQPELVPTIVVHATHPEVRQRFTIAHELGHFVLGHHKRDAGHVLVDRTYTYRGPRASEGLDAIEVAANHFASALLMPTSLMMWAMREYAIDPAFDDDDIENLANKFNVSLQAMTIRLSSLRYF